MAILAGKLFAVADRMILQKTSYRAEVDRRIADARSRLDSRLFLDGWKVGQAMSEEQAIEDALA